MIRGEEFQTLSRQLLAATKDGPFESWCSRLAVLYELAGFDASEIAWHNPPVHVVHDMICTADSRSRIDRLRAAAR